MTWNIVTQEAASQWAAYRWILLGLVWLVIYIAGSTAATNFPVKNALQENYAGPLTLGNCCDGFVTKISSK